MTEKIVPKYKRHFWTFSEEQALYDAVKTYHIPGRKMPWTCIVRNTPALHRFTPGQLKDKWTLLLRGKLVTLQDVDESKLSHAELYKRKYEQTERVNKRLRAELNIAKAELYRKNWSELHKDLANFVTEMSTHVNDFPSDSLG